ncbi:MAG: hypothetical protein ACMXYB_04215 [Candidatus Woesearchaeota archaeon]
MSKEEINNYIKSNLNNGYSIEQIENVLKTSNYDEKEYKPLLDLYKNNDNKTNLSNITDEKYVNSNLKKEKSPKEVLNIIVLIFGILSIIIFAPLAFISIFLYFFSDKRESKKAVLGLILSIIGIIIWIIITIFIAFFVTSSQSSIDRAQDMLNSSTEDRLSSLFQGRVKMYDSPSGDVILEIEEIRNLQNTLMFNELIFEGNQGRVICDSDFYTINRRESNIFEFSKNDGESCDGDFIKGVYNLTMNGIISSIKVENIKYE